MTKLRPSVALLVCLTLSLVSVAEAYQEKKADTNKEKVVGVWEVVKSASNTPPGTIVEFTKDGKLKISYTLQGRSITVPGAYVVDGEKVQVTLTGPDGKGRKETIVIKTLTDKVLVTIDENGKEDEFKKK